MSAKAKPKVPKPPRDFATRSPLVHLLPTGTILHRFFNKSYADPLFFDRSLDGRFNAPDGAYGVNYAAEHQAGAFAETFLRQPGRQSVTRAELDARAALEIIVKADMSLAMIGGKGLARIGATAEITASRPPYRLPQLWSLALHDHAACLDGIAYYSRHDNSQLCYAIFERSRNRIDTRSVEFDLDADWIDDLLDRYQIGLLPF
jgi:RES domain